MTFVDPNAVILVPFQVPSALAVSLTPMQTSLNVSQKPLAIQRWL